MRERIMYVELKTGFDADKGPASVSRVHLSKSGRTVYFKGRTLVQQPSFDANHVDVHTGEAFWISGPKRDCPPPPDPPAAGPDPVPAHAPVGPLETLHQKTIPTDRTRSRQTPRDLAALFSRLLGTAGALTGLAIHHAALMRPR